MINLGLRPEKRSRLVVSLLAAKPFVAPSFLHQPAT